MIRDVVPGDAWYIRRIYNYYITQTTITFEETPVSEAEIQTRIRTITTIPLPWLVWSEQDQVVGYAYARPWQTRSAYRYTVESSVYVEQTWQGQGIGRQLYQTLLERLSDLGIHTIVGSIALPNPSSIALHDKLGFFSAGRFKQVGFKFNQWIDVEYWQRLLD